jgi:acetamidase/formamidase
MIPIRRIAVLSTTLAMVLIVPVQAQPPSRTVRYDLKMEELKYVYGVFPTVARLRAGDFLETNTVDGEGKALEAAGRKPLGPNALTGPFYIEGAEPGDTLVIRFQRVEVDGDLGYGSVGPGFGALNSAHYTPMLGPGIPTQTWTYQIDKAANAAIFRAHDSNFSTSIPLHPFLGCVGVAPADGEVRSALVPAEFGGNMDAAEASAGNTLYLPVNVPGALLFLGDGHGAQGDGEVAGTAIEISTRVRLQVDVIKGKKIGWPRFENDTHLMAVGIYRPVDDALRIAFTELIRWMQERGGLSEMDSYELLSKTAEIHLAEMVDPNYVVVAKINKKFLPAAATRP